jgi:hypothetical protein
MAIELLNDTLSVVQLEMEWERGWDNVVETVGRFFLGRSLSFCPFEIAMSAEITSNDNRDLHMSCTVSRCQGGGPWETGSGLRRRKGECERSVALREGGCCLRDPYVLKTRKRDG